MGDDGRGGDGFKRGDVVWMVMGFWKWDEREQGKRAWGRRGSMTSW